MQHTYIYTHFYSVFSKNTIHHHSTAFNSWDNPLVTWKRWQSSISREACPLHSHEQTGTCLVTLKSEKRQFTALVKSSDKYGKLKNNMATSVTWPLLHNDRDRLVYKQWPIIFHSSKKLGVLNQGTGSFSILWETIFKFINKTFLLYLHVAGRANKLLHVFSYMVINPIDDDPFLTI